MLIKKKESKRYNTNPIHAGKITSDAGSNYGQCRQKM
jgi:hypothetical protein